VVRLKYGHRNTQNAGLDPERPFVTGSFRVGRRGSVHVLTADYVDFSICPSRLKPQWGQLSGVGVILLKMGCNSTPRQRGHFKSNRIMGAIAIITASQITKNIARIINGSFVSAAPPLTMTTLHIS
jgi:hypothetical protein